MTDVRDAQTSTETLAEFKARVKAAAERIAYQVSGASVYVDRFLEELGLTNEVTVVGQVLVTVRATVDGDGDVAAQADEVFTQVAERATSVYVGPKQSVVSASYERGSAKVEDTSVVTPVRPAGSEDVDSDPEADTQS